MKTTLCFLVILVTNLAFSQGPQIINPTTMQPNYVAVNRFTFETSPTYSNSNFSDIGSGFFRGKFIMVSSKKIGGLAKIDPNTQEAYKDIYSLDIDDENNLISHPFLYFRLKEKNFNAGQITFSSDEKTAYHTRSSSENSLEYKLYKSILEDNNSNEWTETILLDINQPNVSIETPYVNHAGNLLYFSANYPDSIGGYDIYVSSINSDGTLGTPKNLGNKINTAEDEKYPSLSLDDTLLFFASKGHESLGGYDIFRSTITTKGVSTSKNLGPTINTAQDDISFFFKTKNIGYISSNKPGGVGSWDVYNVMIHEVVQDLSGVVLDSETQNNLPNAQLTLLDENGTALATTVTAGDGSYKFEIEPSENYTMTISKDGFITTTVPFLSDKSNSDEVYLKDIAINRVTPKVKELPISLEKIYFNFNKWNVSDNSFKTLNKVVKILNEYPEMKLDVDGYTDNIGSADYNLSLSKKRAEAVVGYLVEQGISKDRLEAHGFGETNPLIDCKDQCTVADDQTNRRIQFVIVN